MQPVDLTTLIAACSELRANWLPARLEQVYQRDRYTIALGLRTLNHRGWLDLSWHPQAARVCMGTPPPRTPDTFTFSQQLRHQLGGLALTAITAVSPWERVLDFQFGKRPGDPPLWHLYVEIMGKYSNVILTTADDLIVTAAHQVSLQQSSVRPIQTGQPYQLPPSLTDTIPSLTEPQTQWQERVSLIPGTLRRNLLQNYRGLSSTLVISLIQAANLDPNQSTDSLTDQDWQHLFQQWQTWLITLTESKFYPQWQPTGYTVVPWCDPPQHPTLTVQELLNTYYTQELAQQEFSQLRHQLNQKLSSILNKLKQKAQTFQTRLAESADSDRHKAEADLLMAHLHHWQPGMKAITLPDFTTGTPVTLSLDPEKNAIQNAQARYKQHQKLKRAKGAVEPLWVAVQAEIAYLEQVEATLAQLDTYQNAQDLNTLLEVREELIQQGYLQDPNYRPTTQEATPEFHRHETPSGFEVWVGRNNRQNDLLTFRLAGDYDLWFHAQEIAGSHVLLRLSAGRVPEDVDLQYVADLSAYYSRGRQSDQVPVIYTQPKYVYKPKGAKPGMVIYKHEQVMWGKPERIMGDPHGEI